MLKKLLPSHLKKNIRKIIKFLKYNFRRIRIIYPVFRDQPIKIILGAAETYQKGWYSTNECWLDIANEGHWESVFNGKRIIVNALAEHVFEHLSYAQCQVALKQIHKHMVPGGKIRIAVPDGYNPDKIYLKHVGINGIGDDALSHQQLLNIDTLTSLLTEAGFSTELIEGYDSQKSLVQKTFSEDEGTIRRSRSSIKRDETYIWSFPDSETSLIVDGIRI